MPEPAASEPMDKVYYGAMREEMLRRLELRDRLMTFVFTLSLAGAGATAGLVARSTPGSSVPSLGFALVALLVPLASTASAFLYVQHSRQIAYIARYLEAECKKDAERRSEGRPESIWMPWELSRELASARATEYKWRTAGELCFVAGPAVLVLIVFAPITSFPSTWTAWIIGCIFAAVSTCVVLHHWRWHEKVHRRDGRPECVADAGRAR